MRIDIENRMVVDSEWEPVRVLRPTCSCIECESDIYPGDYYYVIDGDVLCESCIKEYINERFRRCAEEAYED